MEMEVVFYIGIALFVLFGPWILLWRVNRRRKSDHLEDQSRWADLTARLYAVERELKDLRNPSTIPTAKSSAQAPENELQAAKAPAAEPVSSPVPPRPAKVHEPDRPAATLPPAATPPKPPTLAPPVPSVSPAPQAPPSAAPSFSSAELGPSLLERFRSSLDIEEMLGTDWLNKLGIVLLVLGIAFFLAYQLRTMGPQGKVLVGFVTAAVMLGAGIWGERNDRYRIIARAGIGGGWALLFFTTYAMYHVPAAHVVDSQPFDLLLMLAVAAAMVLHTLRYRSQVVTGLAFLLAFSTVTISHVNVYSLAASAVLALGLVAIVLPMRWYEMELFGIVATFGNHFVWLRPIIEPMGQHHRPFPEFFASAGLLAFYWVVFRTSYLVRRIDAGRSESVSTIAALLNSLLLLALMKYQSIYPELAF